MALMRREGSTALTLNPWTEMERFQNRIRRLFDEPFNVPLYRETMGWTPPVEVMETENELTITVELPGIPREDVEIELVNNVLTIRGEKKEEMEKKDKDLLLYERAYGAFQRFFTLPFPVEEATVTAEFKDGVLTVVLPKGELARGRKIAITEPKTI
jgi:HSP20 family protein